jgi:hypothetical protein
MPSKLHMTVPTKFRRMAETPSIIALHYDDLSQNQIEEREGYRVTRPIRAVADVSQDVSPEILSQAFAEARTRGLITEKDVEHYREKLPAFLFPSRKRLKAA